MPWDPFLMKKLLKSEICGSVNSAHHALFTEKVKYFSSKKKKKTEETQNIRLGSANALPKRTRSPKSFSLISMALMVAEK